MIAFAAVLSSCNDYETYGDKKEKERNAIAKFISDSSIVVITEDQFNQQGYTTNLSRNEFVKFDKSGVYMQIVREGCGTKLQDGETTRLVCRFSEFDILDDTTTVCNNNPSLYYYGRSVVALPDIIQVTRTSGSFSASFESGIMYKVYGSASVPSGWFHCRISRWGAFSRLQMTVQKCVLLFLILRGMPLRRAMLFRAIMK